LSGENVQLLLSVITNSNFSSTLFSFFEVIREYIELNNIIYTSQIINYKIKLEPIIYNFILNNETINGDIEKIIILYWDYFLYSTIIFVIFIVVMVFI